MQGREIERDREREKEKERKKERKRGKTHISVNPEVMQMRICHSVGEKRRKRAKRGGERERTSLILQSLCSVVCLITKLHLFVVLKQGDVRVTAVR